MRKGTRGNPIWAAAVVCLLAWGGARAEVVEEIVAWVNGDIITKSELEQEEQTLLAEVYRRFTGAEVEAQVARVRQELLDRLIDRKIMLQRAGHLYDMSKMGDALLESFKDQQKIKTDDDLDRLLAQEGMTSDALKRRLIEIYAPDEVIRFEIANRVGASDQEIGSYYESHAEEFRVPASATFREIVLLAGTDSRKEERRAEAEKVVARVAAPDADFAAVAREVSEAGTRENGGLLGPVGRGDLDPRIEEAVFALPVGQASPLIEMPHGFHIVRVESRSDEHVKGLDEVKESVRAKIEDRKYEEGLRDFLKRAREESDVVVKEEYEHLLSRR